MSLLFATWINALATVALVIGAGATARYAIKAYLDHGMRAAACVRDTRQQPVHDIVLGLDEAQDKRLTQKYGTRARPA